MKKFLIFIAAALCVATLAGCGSEKELTSFEESKIKSAEDIAVNAILPYMNCFMDGTIESLEYPWDEFTMEEVKDQAEYLYYLCNYYGLFSSSYNNISVDGYGFYNAISSFEKTAEEVGSITRIGEVSSQIDGTQIVVTVETVCQEGNAKAEIIFSNDLFCNMESASITQNLSMGQKMSKAGLNTLMGIGTVFVMLILISLLISLLGIVPKVQKKIADSKAAKEAEKNATANGIDNAVNQIIANETAPEELSDDTELVAVIAAAIAAYEGSASASGYVVRSIRRR